MVLDAIGLILPYAAAIALGPLPIIAAVLVADSSASRHAGWGFAVGWFVGIALLATVLALLVGSLGEATQNGPVVNWLRVAVGLLLLGAAARKLQLRQDADTLTVPKWQDSFSAIAPGRAVRVGATLALANPKHLAFVAAPMSSLHYATTTPAELSISIAVFALLSSSSVLAIVVLHALGGERAAGVLEAAKQYMIRHSSSIVVVVLALLGASILGSGLAGLSD